MVTTLVALLLSVQVVNQSTVTLAWDANTEANIASYLVQYSKTSGGPYGGDTWVNGSTVTTTLTGLEPGQTYYFVVRSVNTAGLYSGFSNEPSATMPIGPLSDQCAPITGRYNVQIFPLQLIRSGSKGPGSITRFYYDLGSPNSPITAVIIGIDGTAAAREDGTDLTASAGQKFTMPASGDHALTITATNAQGCTKTVSAGTLKVP